MDTNSAIYKTTAAVNKARKAHKIWTQPMEEKYVLDNFYAFARGDFFVALTNSHDTVDVSVPNAPFAEGSTVCNIFSPQSDCQQVNGGTINVHLENG